MAEPKAKVPGALRVTKPGVRTYERSRKASFFLYGFITNFGMDNIKYNRHMSMQNL